jgi:hypothetical protein
MGVRAAAAGGPKLPPNLIGIALAMTLYQEGDLPSEPGFGSFEIDQQFNRRALGAFTLQSETGWTIFNTINITLPRGGEFVGTGDGPNGKFELRGDLVEYDGGAVISTTGLRFNPVNRRVASASILALRGFDVATDPPVFGVWQGSFQSSRNPFFQGLANLSMAPSDTPGLSFQGGLTMATLADQPVILEFDQFGTIRAADGRFVLIGQGGSRRLTAEGFISSSPERGIFADALYRVLSQDGTTDYGAYNFSVTPPAP